MKLEFQKSKTAVFFHFSMQYSFQLADTVGAKKKKLSAYWRCPSFGKFSISVLISRTEHFSLPIRCSWVD